MASNPNNPNPRDEPVRLLEAAVERGPDDAGDYGSILDLESDPMDVDDDDEDEDEEDDSSFYSESDDEEEEDDDDEEEEGDEDEEEEEDNQMDLSGDDEEEGCDQSGSGGGGGGGDCPICFRSWKSEGRHRICCTPCGHVYGRSCLEKWLKRHGKNTGTCPQCKRELKKQDIINLYAQLTAVTNDDIVAPSEVMSTEGGHRVEGGERTQTQDEQQGWRLTKESWDTVCSRVDTLSTINEELHNRLHAFEGRIMKIVEGFGVKVNEMLDATGERLGKKVDENFKKLFEFCMNPSDTSKNPFDISSPDVGVAPLPLEANFEKILEAMEEKIGKKMYEKLKKGFEAYGTQFGSPCPKFGPTPSSSVPEDTAS